MSRTVRPGQRAGAALSRERYLTTLRLTPPEPQRLTHGALRGVPRREFQSVVSALRLPPQWVPDATSAIQAACGDFVAPATLQLTDLFLCALIHPSYVRSPLHGSTAAVAQLRQRVAMPAEVALAGASSLRVVMESIALHARSRAVSDEMLAARVDAELEGDNTANEGAAQQSPRRRDPVLLNGVPLSFPSLGAPELLLLPHTTGLGRMVLYDAKAFPRQQQQQDDAACAVGSPSPTLPTEVALAMAIAVCGAVELCCGLPTLARFLDHYCSEDCDDGTDGGGGVREAPK